MRAILTQVRAAILRRRAQTATVLIISIMAGTIATMALTLLVRSTQPWDAAFAKTEGPHLHVQVDAAAVSVDQLKTTATLPGVTGASPPRPTALVAFHSGDTKGKVQLIGRDDPGGALDRLPLIAGRWPNKPGEIAVTGTKDTSVAFRPQVGDTIQALTGTGTRDFKVVAQVVDLVGHGGELDYTNGVPGAWVLPADLMSMVDGSQVRLGYQIAYRFQHASNENELNADRKQIAAALPEGSQTMPARDWLTGRSGSIWFITMISSIIWAFTVFALLAVAVIVASVVAGSVLAGYREIGILKAIGFTPAGVVAVYVGQMVVPALFGALAGIPLGVLAARPLLDDASHALMLPDASAFDPALDAEVVLGLLALTILSSAIPAFRAGAVDSITAIRLGSAPPAERRSRVASRLRRLGAPRPFSLGAGDAFARPVRAILTVVALAIGIATVTFSIGFQNTLQAVLKVPAFYGYGQDVTIHRYGALPDRVLMGKLAADGDTDLVVSQRMLLIRVPGEPNPDPITFVRGDAEALGYAAVEGRWFKGPGEAVIGLAVAKKAHLNVGDTFTGALAGGGGSVPLRVVGILNDFNSGGHGIRAGWESLLGAQPDATPEDYLVKLRPGADRIGYAKRVNALAPDYLDAKATNFADVEQYSGLLTWMVATLALVLLLIAAAGVFNATLLTTRERVRDIAVLKALGMTGWQVAQLALGATTVLALVAAVAGVPLGLWMEMAIWQSMGGALGVVILPSSSAVAVIPLLLALAIAFGIALSGAALPARWAAATPVARVLRSE